MSIYRKCEIARMMKFLVKVNISDRYKNVFLNFLY